MKLNPKHVTLNGLLQDRLFRIPDYQRAYAWGSKQRSDLFADIEEINRSQQDHFMATVVCLAREKRRIVADEFQDVEIVDGQQRLTTFIMLIKAIEVALSAEESLEAKIKRELNELLVKHDDNTTILLQTNHDTSHIFMDYLRTGIIASETPKTNSDKNLIDAARECTKFVVKWKADHNIIDLVAILRNRMSMIYHELDEEATVYRVFEVLNSRGLDVKWIDKLKSQLMGLIFSNATSGARDAALKEMHVIWQGIYRVLGLRGELGDEALRFAGTLRSTGTESKVLGQEDAVSVLVEEAGTKLRTISEVARWLSSVVEAVDSLDRNRRLGAVTQVAHARFLAAAILLKKFSPQVEARLLRVWEKVTFRIFGLSEKDARHHVGEYVRLGCDIFKEKVSAVEIESRLQAIGKEYPIKPIVDGIGKWTDCYTGWTEELRYLLYRYDEHLVAEQGGDLNQTEWNKIWSTDVSKSIEHILPQSSNSPIVHHIGNLTMLPPGVNSSLKDNAPKDKVAKYKETGLRATAAVGEVIARKGWSRKLILERAALIGKFIKKEWAD